ncbi:MAG: hypothetical protein E6Z02_01515 [Bifidobacterium breve]|nr:hypothetical protein [Bifidobacterium breve]
MNNTTRAVIATAAIGALLIPLAGCGNTTTSSGKTELTVWSWDNQHQSRRQILHEGQS